MVEVLNYLADRARLLGQYSRRELTLPEWRELFRDAILEDRYADGLAPDPIERQRVAIQHDRSFISDCERQLACAFCGEEAGDGVILSLSRLGTALCSRCYQYVTAQVVAGRPVLGL